MALNTTGFTKLGNFSQKNINGRTMLSNLLSSDDPIKGTSGFSVEESGGDLNVFRNNVNNTSTFTHFNRATQGTEFRVTTPFFGNGETFFGKQYFFLDDPLLGARKTDIEPTAKIEIDGVSLSPELSPEVFELDGFLEENNDKVHYAKQVFRIPILGIPQIYFDSNSPEGGLPNDITSNTQIRIFQGSTSYQTTFTSDNELKITVPADEKTFTEGDTITKITLKADPDDLGLRGYFHLRQQFDETSYGMDTSPLGSVEDSAVKVSIKNPIGGSETALTGRYLYDSTEGVWYNAANSALNNPNNSPIDLTDDNGFFFYDVNSPQDESPHQFATGFWAFGKTINAAKGISGARVILIGGNNNSPFLDNSPDTDDGGFWNIGNDNSPSGWSLPLESPEDDDAIALLAIVEKMKFTAPVGLRYSGKYTYNSARNVWEDEDSPSNAEFKLGSNNRWEFHYEGGNKYQAIDETDHPWQADWTGFTPLMSNTSPGGAFFDTTNVTLADTDTVIEVTDGVIKNYKIDYSTGTKSFVVGGHSFAVGTDEGQQTDVTNTFDTSSIILTRRNGVTQANFLNIGEYDAQLYGKSVELLDINKEKTYVSLFNAIESPIRSAKAFHERTVSRRETTRLKNNLFINGLLRFRDTQNQVVESDTVISDDAPGIFLLSNSFDDSPILIKRAFSETSKVWEVDSGNIQLQTGQTINLAKIENTLIFDEAINIGVEAAGQLIVAGSPAEANGATGEWNDTLSAVNQDSPTDTDTFTHRMILEVEEIDPDDGSTITAEYGIIAIRGDDI